MLPFSAPGASGDEERNLAAGGIHPEIRALLSADEIGWLKAHPVIRVAGPKAFPPFHAYDDRSQPSGIASDYIRLVGKRLGLKIRVDGNLPWPEVLRKAKVREIDVIACAARTEEREKFLLFSSPYLSFPLVIVSRKNAPFIGGTEYLHDKKVACIRKNSVCDWLVRDGITIIPHLTATPLESLTAVATGQTDTYIGNLAAVTYLIEKNGLANLKIAAPTPYGNYELFVAARSDWPEMITMVNKVLLAMDPSEHAAIRTRWLSVRYEFGISIEEVVRWVLMIVGPLAGLVLLVFAWNRRLRKEACKRMEAAVALRESEARYRSLFEGMPSGIVYASAVLDDAGRLCDCRYIAMNPAYERLTGLVKEKAAGHTVLELMPGTEPAWFDMLDSVVKTGVAKSFEMYHDFTEKHYAVSAYRLRPGTFVAVLRDITQRVIAEKEKAELRAQLDRSKKMEAVGALAGGVAHDLNNILSGIVSYPELLLMDLPEGSPLTKPVQSIKRAGERAATIVQDLLTLSRRGVAATGIVDLNRIISEYLDSPEYKSLVRFHPGVTMATRLSDNLPDLAGSPFHLSKVVMNLVSNAAEAMPAGGALQIVTESRYMDKPVRGYNDVAAGNYVVLTVADDGIGIPGEEIERIFEPFYTKKVMGRSGTGLGMAVVWGTVEDLGGYIDVRSSEGEGTTFRLYFPVTRRTGEEAPPRPTIAELAGCGESVLVVDDVEQQREIATAILTKLGYAVTAVASGEAAIAYLENNAADLVVLDMIMAPGINGRQTYEGIIRLHPGQKAVITSGFAETGEVRRTQALGAGAYISKPYALEKLGAAVRHALSDHSK